MTYMTCGECALYDPTAHSCQIMISAMRGKMFPEDSCTKYKFKNQVYNCEICGHAIIDPIIEIKEDKNHFYCDDCVSRIKDS